MMEPDDFRAGLISMGYDLVSAMATSEASSGPLPLPGRLLTQITFSAHHTHAKAI